MTKIKKIEAREILSSGSYPTIEVKVTLSSTMVGIASVPFGVSAGSHEAFTLIDNDQKRFLGKGMLKAVENVNKKIAPKLIGMEPYDQREIDRIMIELDGTENKSNLGGNSILAVSLAVAKAAANERMIPFYQYIRETFRIYGEWRLPNPMMVVIEGGKHADNSTDIQEYCVSTFGEKTATENVRMGIEIYQILKKILIENGLNTNVGNEGAFAPSGLMSNEIPLKLITEAIKKSGYNPLENVGISIDAAASEFFRDGKYHLKIEDKKLSSEELIEYYLPWIQKYPIVTIEDMLSEDDWENWPLLMEKMPGILNIGDDLTVTNIKRLEKAINTRSINAILIKPNQIGTLTECIDCCLFAKNNGIVTIVSHRGGGETNDTTMVDIAVAVNSSFIKVGPSRGERVCKYNRLMEIEDELGEMAKPVGKDFKKVL
ncbi:MAG: phosphopyruvate hydratase [Candidatus Aenigmatarchaeota archaeon]